MLYSFADKASNLQSFDIELLQPGLNATHMTVLVCTVMQPCSLTWIVLVISGFSGLLNAQPSGYSEKKLGSCFRVDV